MAEHAYLPEPETPDTQNTSTGGQNTLYQNAGNQSPPDPTLPGAYFEYIVRKADTWPSIATRFHLDPIAVTFILDEKGKPADLKNPPTPGTPLQLPLDLMNFPEAKEVEPPGVSPQIGPKELKAPFPVGYKEYFKLRELQDGYHSFYKLGSMFPDPAQRNFPTDPEQQKFYKIYGNPQEGIDPLNAMYLLAPILGDAKGDFSIGGLFSRLMTEHGNWLRNKPGYFALALFAHAGALGGGGFGIVNTIMEANKKENGREDNGLDFVGDLIKDLEIPLSQQPAISGEIFGQKLTQDHSLNIQLPGGSMSGMGVKYNYRVSQHARLLGIGNEFDQFKYKEKNLWHIPDLDKIVDSLTLEQLKQSGVLKEGMEVNPFLPSLSSKAQFKAQKKADKRKKKGKEEEEPPTGNDFPFVNNGFYGPPTHQFTASPYAQLANHRPTGKFSASGGTSIQMKILDQKGNFLQVKTGSGLSWNQVDKAGTDELTELRENLFLNNLVFNAYAGIEGKMKFGQEHQLSASVSGEFRRTLTGPDHAEWANASAGIKWESKMRNGNKFVFSGEFKYDPWGGPKKFQLPMAASVKTRQVIIELEYDPLGTHELKANVKVPLNVNKGKRR